jgi:hypothetical protein
MAFVGLFGFIAQVPPPGGSGWQGWVFLGMMVVLPIVIARLLARK